MRWATTSPARWAALAIGRGGTRRGGRGGETATIGTVQTVGLAAGFLFLSLNQAVLSEPQSLLFGTFLGITHTQVLVLLGVAVVAVALLAVIARPLLFATVDRDVAQRKRGPGGGDRRGLLADPWLAIAATSQITGALLVFALLVAPPAAAQLLTSARWPAWRLSIGFGLVIVWLGLGIAYFSIYPVGFYVTTLAFGLYVALRIGGWIRRRRR